MLLIHIRKNHKNLDKFRCIEPDCRRSFSSFNSFYKHRKKWHVDNIDVQSTSNDNPDSPEFSNNEPGQFNSELIETEPDFSLDDGDVFQVFDEDAVNLDFISPDVDPSVPLLNENFKTKLQSIYTLFVSKLYAYPGLPRIRVADILDDVSEMLSKQIEICENVPDNEIRSLLKNLKNPFAFMGNTEHTRCNYFEKIGTYIRPEPIKLGEIKYYKTQPGIPESRELKHVTCSAQFVPLRKVLKQFFQLPNVLSNTLSYIDFLKNDNLVSNFIQCKLWKEKIGAYEEAGK